MSEPSDQADQIRNKRLAKLNAVQTSGSSSSSTLGQSSAAAAPPIAPQISSTQKSTPYESTAATRKTPSDSVPDDPLSKQPSSMPSRAPNPIKINGLAQRLSPHRSDTSPRRSRSPRSSRPGAFADPLEWEDATLSNLFRISLKADRTQDSRRNRLYYTAGVAAHATAEGLPLRWTSALLDDAIVEAGTALGPLTYLLSCWKRICRFQRGFSGRVEPFMTEIVKEARRLCMSYIIFACELPDMFGQENSQGSPLAPYLIREPEGDDGVCHDFLTEIDSRMADDEMAVSALISALEQLSMNLSRLSFTNPEYQTYLNILSRFVHFKQISIAITLSSRFLPDVDEPASLAEIHSLLGPFFRISTLQIEVQDSYYDAATRNDPQRALNAQRSLQLPGRIHQAQLFEISNSIIRTSAEAREKMLEWFGAFVRLNLRRKGMQADEKKFSSDGFMLNLTSVLDKLCDPFMDSSFSKIDRADIDYFRRNPRIDVDDETKLNADQKEAKQYHSQPVAGSANFITEVFFLTAAMHHYGAGVAQDKLADSDKNLKYLRKNLAQIKLEEQKLSQDPRVSSSAIHHPGVAAMI